MPGLRVLVLLRAGAANIRLGCPNAPKPAAGARVLLPGVDMLPPNGLLGVAGADAEVAAPKDMPKLRPPARDELE